MNADDLDSCVSPFQGATDAGDEPASPDRGDDYIQRRVLGQNLQSDGSLSGDHRFVIERVDKCSVRLPAPFNGAFIGLIIGGPMQHDLRAMGTGGG